MAAHNINSEFLSELETPCQNCEANCCNTNIHNIIYNMLKENPQHCCKGYVGGLFSGEYKVFTQKECIQYLQEYVPLHIPQIEYVLSYVLPKICQRNLFANPISVLDIASGPATIALSLCKVRLCRNIRVTTLEASSGFNSIIEIFRTHNTNPNIKIVETIQAEFYDFLKKQTEHYRGHFDWIVIANFISGIAKNGNSAEVDAVITQLCQSLMNPGQQILLTIIEGSSKKYFDTEEYLKTLEQHLNGLNIKVTLSSFFGPRDTPYLANCKIYQTTYQEHFACINTKSLLLELI